MKSLLLLKMAILNKFPNQADFAMAAGEHESFVSRVIHNRQKITEKKAKQWCKILGCNYTVFGPMICSKKS